MDARGAVQAGGPHQPEARGFRHAPQGLAQGLRRIAEVGAQRHKGRDFIALWHAPGLHGSRSVAGPFGGAALPSRTTCATGFATAAAALLGGCRAIGGGARFGWRVVVVAVFVVVRLSRRPEAWIRLGRAGRGVGIAAPPTARAASSALWLIDLA